MSNSCRGTNSPLVSFREEKLRGRDDALRELKDHIRDRRSVVVMGVEGVGKSSLLNCCFSLDYRRQMAREQHLLIRVTDFLTTGIPTASMNIWRMRSAARLSRWIRRGQRPSTKSCMKSASRKRGRTKLRRQSSRMYATLYGIMNTLSCL